MVCVKGVLSVWLARRMCYNSYSVLCSVDGMVI